MLPVLSSVHWSSQFSIQRRTPSTELFFSLPLPVICQKLFTQNRERLVHLLKGITVGTEKFQVTPISQVLLKTQAVPRAARYQMTLWPLASRTPAPLSVSLWLKFRHGRALCRKCWLYGETTTSCSRWRRRLRFRGTPHERFFTGTLCSMPKGGNGLWSKWFFTKCQGPK
jgi:hypothetical protein